MAILDRSPVAVAASTVFRSVKPAGGLDRGCWQRLVTQPPYGSRPPRQLWFDLETLFASRHVRLTLAGEVTGAAKCTIAESGRKRLLNQAETRRPENRSRVSRRT